MKLLKRGVPVAISRLHPKLRMVSDGDFEVNAIRASQSGLVSIVQTKAVKDFALSVDQVMEISSVLPEEKMPKIKPLKKQTSDVETNVFIDLLPNAEFSSSQFKFLKNPRVKGSSVVARIALSDLEKLNSKTQVKNVEASQPLQVPQPKINDPYVKLPTGDMSGLTDVAGDKGANVLIGIIDVQGFDFSHEDFLDDKGNTRFYSIWDQGAKATNKKQHPKGFDYGVEITRDDMNRAIKESKNIGAPAYELEPQTQMAEGSHGTHVTSIAAGNSGVCPKATIAAVLISLSEDVANDRRKSFYDSASVAHAVDYLFELGEKLKLPVSINVSLGTNGGAHDGSEAICRWIDAALTTQGRCISVAAGNAGQEKAKTETDMGYIMGRIHTSGKIAARGLANDLEWNVVGNRIADFSENELEIWYSSQDRFGISILPPGGSWIGPILPGEFLENQLLDNGTILSVYNTLYHPCNGHNYVGIYLSPYYDQVKPYGVKAGVWKVRMHGDEIRDGSYHAWIERDDPRPHRVNWEGREVWNFPSFFSELTNVDNASISSLACAQSVIGVANLDKSAEEINISSSQGPTRDERKKPEVAAPGTEITAAKGFSKDEHNWISMTGTSMASPYVCGVAGLMLSSNKNLLASQISGVIKRTSDPLPGQDYQWRNDSGYGIINPSACLKEANLIDKNTELNLQ